MPKLSPAAAMAGSKTVLMSFVVLALIVVACLPTVNGVRELGVSDVQELSMVEQEQVVSVQEEDMESAKRQLLSYDPYYNKWYGGKH
ncbi:hypothetical protein KP509_37G045300 [Ceratopteris richardii]|uniref:Uncharacterized protein n=2 Tax=Ceratopteris richardii TaxID=49495 RepID=A0A8T2Q8H6_CERRI|nr:hypothetical protein KP509_37G045300 [Ceratopteris richardii]